MLLGVVPEGSDFFLEAGLDQGHGGEGHAGAAAPLALDGADIAESDGVVGGGHGFSAVSDGLIESLGLRVRGEGPLDKPSVAGQELVIGQVAELVDLVPPGLVAGQEGPVPLSTCDTSSEL